MGIANSNPIPAWVRANVLTRDGHTCVASKIGADQCAARMGGPAWSNTLELDHVRGNPPVGILEKTREGGKGKQPPSDEKHLVTLCHHHHHDGWATSHRPQLRRYLELVTAGERSSDAAAVTRYEFRVADATNV